MKVGATIPTENCLHLFERNSSIKILIYSSSVVLLLPKIVIKREQSSARISLSMQPMHHQSPRLRLRHQYSFHFFSKRGLLIFFFNWAYLERQRGNYFERSCDLYYFIGCCIFRNCRCAGPLEAFKDSCSSERAVISIADLALNHDQRFTSPHKGSSHPTSKSKKQFRDLQKLGIIRPSCTRPMSQSVLPCLKSSWRMTNHR